MNVLSIHDVSKKYGIIKALRNVSFDVPKGTVFGILGPNGSGKTTLLSIIVGILAPTTGSFELLGEPANNIVRKRIGTLLETPNFYHYLSAVQNLKINCAIKGVSETDIDRVLHLVNLYERKDSKFSTYSLGMKQRLAIGSALLGDPEILFLDEPTNGLDPVGIAEIRKLIQLLHERGHTIIMASHLLDEVEKVCTHVAILKKGVLITSGDVRDIFTGAAVAALGCTEPEKLMQLLPAMPGYISHKQEPGFISLNYDAALLQLQDINQLCFKNDIVLNQLQPVKKSLEEKFIELTGGGGVS